MVIVTKIKETEGSIRMETLQIALKGRNFRENLIIIKSCNNPKPKWNMHVKKWFVKASKENLLTLSKIDSIKDEMLARIDDMELNIERELLRATVTPEGAYDLKIDYPFLFDYQCIAAHYIIHKEKYLVADEMGLGKTIQCMPYIDKMYKDGKKIIILCPSSIAHQWVSEIDRFISLPSTNIVGMVKDKRLSEYTGDSNIIVTTYESFRNDLKVLREMKYDFSGVCVIADEASKFKNRETGIYKELRLVSQYFAGFIALTGTPIENDLSNFFNIISVINPKFMTRAEFEDRYCIFNGDKQKCTGYRNLKDFIHRIAQIMIRRTKNDVTELPPANIQNRIIEMTKEQRVCTNGVRKYFSETGNLGCVILLREIANDTGLLNPFTSTVIQDIQKKGLLPSVIPSASNKIPECLDVLKEIGDNRVIIFTMFTKMAFKLEERLKKEGYTVKVLHGNDSVDTRNEWVEKFKYNEFQILIATDIFGYGVNLQFCDYMINFDIPWNPAKLNQRIGRIHRQGSDKIKTVINLLCEDIDEHVYEVVKSKQDLFDTVVEGKIIDDENIRRQILQKLI